MDAAEVRKSMGRRYAAHQPIKASLGGDEIQIRTCLSVGDAERILPTLGDFTKGIATLGTVSMLLFEVLAEGTDGKPIVEPGDRDWFEKCGMAGEIVGVIEKSGVLPKILEAFAPSDEEDSEPEGKPKA